jgi:hypothetical protein
MSLPLKTKVEEPASSELAEETSDDDCFVEEAGRGKVADPGSDRLELCLGHFLSNAAGM